MRAKKTLALMLLAAAGFLLAADYPETPEKVAEAYWQALLRGDSAAAYPFLSRNMKSTLSQADFDKQLAMFRGSKDYLLEITVRRGMGEVQQRYMAAFYLAMAERIEFVEIKNVKSEGESASLTTVLRLPDPEDRTPEMDALETTVREMMTGTAIDDAALLEKCRAALRTVQVGTGERLLDLIKEEGQWRIDDRDALFEL